MNEWEIPPVKDTLFNLIAKCRFGMINLACSPEEAKKRQVEISAGTKLKKIVAPPGSRLQEFLEKLGREHAPATLELMVACVAANTGMITKIPLVAAGSPESDDGEGSAAKYPCIYLDTNSGERSLDKCSPQAEDCGGVSFLVQA